MACPLGGFRCIFSLFDSVKVNSYWYFQKFFYCRIRHCKNKKPWRLGFLVLEKMAENFTHCEEEKALLKTSKDSKNKTPRITTAIWRISGGLINKHQVGWLWPILYILCETSTWHLDSCPPEDTWYGVILWVLRVLGQG